MWNLLSDFGGIFGILMPLVVAINSPVSYVFIMAQMIAKLYFLRPPNKKIKDISAFNVIRQYFNKKIGEVRTPVQKIRFSMSELLFNVRYIRPLLLCCKVNKKFMQKIRMFDHLRTRLEDETKLVNIVQR